MPRPPPRSTLFPYTTLFRSTGTASRFSSPDTATQPIPSLGKTAKGLLRRPRLIRYTRPIGRNIARRDAPAKIGRAHVELQSHVNLVCRLLLEKKKNTS